MIKLGLKSKLTGLVLLFFLMQFLGVGIVYVANWLMGCGYSLNEITMMPQMVAYSLFLSNVLLCLSFFLLRLYNKENFRLQGLHVKDFMATWALMFPVILIVNMLVELFDPIDLNKETIRDLAYHPLGVLAITLIGPLAEELVFRVGCMKLMLDYKLAPWLAILFSSLIFGVAHGNPAQIGGAVLMGVVLGWLYWRSKSFWLPFVAHVFNNSLAIVLLWCYGGEEITIQEMRGAKEFDWLFFLVNLLFAAALFFYLHRRFSIIECEREKGNGAVCSEVHRNDDM